MVEGPASLRLSLAELRGGPTAWTRSLESPHAAIPGLPEQLEGPLTVRIRATLAEDGGIRVLGRVSDTAVLECRRCLTPVRCEIESGLEAWFRRDALVGPEEEGVWAFDPEAAEVDLRITQGTLGNGITSGTGTSTNPYVVTMGIDGDGR